MIPGCVALFCCINFIQLFAASRQLPGILLAIQHSEISNPDIAPIYNSLFLNSFFLLLFVAANSTYSFCQQIKQVEGYGFRHFPITYKNDSVDTYKISKWLSKKTKALVALLPGQFSNTTYFYDEKGGVGTFPFATAATMRELFLSTII